VRTPTVTLLKLADHALERGDVESAREALGAVLVLAAEEETRPAPTPETSARPRAARVKTFAAMIDAKPRYVHGLIGSVPLPTIGSGRGLRVLVDEALAALRTAETRTPEQEGAAYVRRRAALKIVPGSR
jgi:hypothetical protein